MKQLLISLTLCLILPLTKILAQANHSNSRENTMIQANALKVLQDECNACHKVYHPSKYFELENMNAYAKKIERQVFLWKRMPKGKEHTLSEHQQSVLKIWINNQLNNK